MNVENKEDIDRYDWYCVYCGAAISTAQYLQGEGICEECLSKINEEKEEIKNLI